MSKVFCPTCNEEKEIVTPGSYCRILECQHVLTGPLVENVVKAGAPLVEAKSISESLNRLQELPKIDSNELIQRATRGSVESYEDFFNSESLVIKDLIDEHGKDNALIYMMTIHAHMAKILFTMNRFRNFYFENIKSMQKEVEDKAVKELISTHDFHYTPADKKPKKVRTVSSQSGTDMDAARNGLTKLGVNPADLMKVMGNLMWKKSPEEMAKQADKDDYNEGLKKIRESVSSDKKE